MTQRCNGLFRDALIVSTGAPLATQLLRLQYYDRGYSQLLLLSLLLRLQRVRLLRLLPATDYHDYYVCHDLKNYCPYIHLRQSSFFDMYTHAWEEGEDKIASTVVIFIVLRISKALQSEQKSSYESGE
jgi:hypothetical protein